MAGRGARGRAAGGLIVIVATLLDVPIGIPTWWRCLRAESWQAPACAPVINSWPLAFLDLTLWQEHPWRIVFVVVGLVIAASGFWPLIRAQKNTPQLAPLPLSQEQKDHFIAEAYSIIALTDPKTAGAAERMHGGAATAEAIREQERGWAQEVSVYLTRAQRASFCADISVPFGISEIQSVAGRMNERLRRLREIPPTG
jgi:hypothetical protein